MMLPDYHLSYKMVSELRRFVSLYLPGLKLNLTEKVSIKRAKLSMKFLNHRSELLLNSQYK